MTKFPFAPVKYGKRTFKIFYGKMAFDIFIFKKKIKGCNVGLLSHSLQLGDFDKENFLLENDILVIEYSNIKTEDQLLCDKCGIINRNEPCEHMLENPNVVSWYNRRISTEKLNAAMKTLRLI